MRRAIYILSLLLCTALPVLAAKNSRATREPSDGLRFLYRAGERIDRYLMQGIDTSYITLHQLQPNCRFVTDNRPGTTALAHVIERGPGFSSGLPIAGFWL